VRGQRHAPAIFTPRKDPLRVVGTKITASETLRPAVSTNLPGRGGGWGGGNGAKIFRKLRQEDEKDLVGKLATRTSTKIHDFVFQETVTSKTEDLFHCSTVH